jgi:hypothetical protein
MPQQPAGFAAPPAPLSHGMVPSRAAPTVLDAGSAPGPTAPDPMPARTLSERRPIDAKLVAGVAAAALLVGVAIGVTLLALDGVDEDGGPREMDAGTPARATRKTAPRR